MEARDRRIPQWFQRIESGQVLLPRFQRFVAWSHKEVCSLLEAVLRGLPAGASLILEIGDKQPFVSRPMVGAPNPTERATEHLLDGQQRLTALWRSFHDHFDDRTYFVKMEEDEEHGGEVVPQVIAQSRYAKNGKRYPTWVDAPDQVHQREMIPLRLLRPGDITKEIDEWCKAAVGESIDALLKLKDTITNLRERVTDFNLPFLSLPTGTPKDIALDVFIKMNTSSVPLKAYDIVVAQMEAAADQSLHALVSEIMEKAPLIEHYVAPADLVLSTAALREGRPPTQASFLKLDMKRLLAEWQKIADGIAFTAGFLDEEKIFDAARLPTITILPVLAAIHDSIPEALDARGNAMTLLRKYLWRSFFTQRYETSTGPKALKDLQALREIITEGKPETTAPIFREEDYPLPDVDELKRATWPKKRDTLARAVQSVCLRGGAHDLADGTTVSREHLKNREYHHLFPDAILTNSGKLDSEQIYRALNCALITWNTNRNISAKEPIQYLKERVQRSALGEDEIRSRLATHAVPFDALNKGGYAEMTDEAARAKKIQEDYSAFLEERAKIVLEGIKELCAGRKWQGQRAELSRV